MLVFPIFFLHNGRDADGQVWVCLLDVAHGEHHHLQHDVGLDFPRVEGFEQEGARSHRRRYRYADTFNHHHWLRDVSERLRRRALIGPSEPWLVIGECWLPKVPTTMFSTQLNSTRQTVARMVPLKINAGAGEASQPPRMVSRLLLFASRSGLSYEHESKLAYSNSTSQPHARLRGFSWSTKDVVSRVCFNSARPVRFQ